MTTTEAPLAGYKIIGVRENWYQAAPEAPRQPGGACWHCGTAIAVEVLVKEAATGKVETIGSTCAERVGLDVSELKAMLAERYAEQRAELARTRSKAYRDLATFAESFVTCLYGLHGTTSRYLAGCYCDPCIAAAPHGTWHRFTFGGCHCLDCVATVADEVDRYQYRDIDVIVDITTGRIVDARKVDTRYGYRWCVRDGAAWLPVSPARRQTQAKHGYVQATARYLVEVCGNRRDRWYRPLVLVASPLVDAWAEPIAHDDQASR